MNSKKTIEKIPLIIAALYAVVTFGGAIVILLNI